MENTQVEVVKKQVGKALEVVQGLSVITTEDYSRAVEVGTRIKEVSKEIDEFIKDKEFLDLCTKEELNEKRISNRMVKSNTYLDKK